MTVALGLDCQGDYVLCTDSQVTKEGGLKYEEEKIFHWHTDDWCVALGYSGLSPYMKTVCEQLANRLQQIANESEERFPEQVKIELQDILEQTYKAHRRDMQLEAIS